MTQDELLGYLLKSLNKIELPYMITGAYAVSIHGEPRATHDIDFKVDAKTTDAEKISKCFEKEFYVDQVAIVDAIRNRNVFNIIHSETNMKIDFWPLKDTSFDKIRFKRRQKEIILGVETYVSSPEDTVLIKLDWFKRSGSEKHITDAKGIVKVQGNLLDLKYINQWAKKLSILRLWKELEEK